MKKVLKPRGLVAEEELCHEKTGLLPIRKQRRRSAVQ